MRPRQILTTLALPATTLSLPTSPLSPTSPRSPIDPSSPSITPRDDSTAQTCSLYKYADTPTNAPACWAWYAPTTEPADYCGGSTFTSITSLTTPTQQSTEWLDSCTALRATQLASPRDFFLAAYATDKYNTLLSSGNCALQVRPATAPSSEQVYVGGTDVADILGSAIESSRRAGGGEGVEGSMTCSPGVVGWRMVRI